ncbi:GIP [Symbiodinium natans]|uniref:GIP protein n=1 Tax=Symbiodinium natans TaxID=878477 RepID=A0A812IDI6_9DINO|nr:GIP [Symbiodinium natans]
MLEHARGTKFSMEFQSLQEKAQKHGKQPKGRLLLWVVFQRFRLEKDRGTALTQHHLLSLTVQGSEVKGLIEFRQRFDFVWEALEPSERPSDNAVRSLLFENLKGRPLMSLHIDRFRNSSSSSSKRTWEWLYGKMVDVVDIAQLEENTASISKALAGGNNRVAANAAPKAQAKEKAKPNNGDKSEQDKAKEKKEREKAKKKEKEKETKEKARAAATVATSEAATPAPAAPAKGKGKGKDKPKSPRAKEEKAKLPCMFFAYDCCTHGNACEYIHDKNNLYKGPKPRGIKASAGAATVAAGVAMASALPTAKGSCVEEWQCGNACPSEQESPKAFTTVMTAMACLDPGGNATGMAGVCTMNQTKNLISKKHLPEETHEMFSKAPEKLQFSTGGGTRTGSQAVRMKGDLSGDNVFYSLKDCPPALSVGIQVNEHKRPWIWFPDQLPFFVKADRVQDVTFFCPESAKIYADRIEENVPVLRESVSCSALPACGRAVKPEAETLMAAPSEPAPTRDKPVESGKADAECLRLKPDSSLPRFGEEDELTACAEPIPGGGDEPLDEEDAEEHPEWTPSLRERLIAASKSLAHQLTHYPKNRYCDICKRAKMTAKVHRSRKDEGPDPDDTPPLHYGHRLRADHIILGQDLTKGSEGEQACLIAYDDYSGCYGAFPQTNRSTDQNVSVLRKFGGTRAHGKALCVVKSDAASELVDAVKALSWLPDPGVPHDLFHNSQLERAIRTFPGIFCGWRLDAGYKFRGVHLVLDYDSLRKDERGCGRPIQVYASELVVEKLSLFKSEAAMPMLDAREALPFEKGAPEPKVRKRKTYVTLERALRFGVTLGCKGCDRIAEGVPHNDACHERFRKLLEDEAAALKAKAKAKADAARPASDSVAPAAPLQPSREATCPDETKQGVKGADLDYWDFDSKRMAWKRVHVKPRKRLYTPVGRHCPFDFHLLSSARETEWKCRGKLSTFSDDWQDKSPNRRISSKSWVGATWFFPKKEIDPNQAKLDTMKANAEEQLKRSPLKGAQAVAAILHDLEALDPKAVPSFGSTLTGDSAPTSASSQTKVKRNRRAEDATLFEFCCEPDSMLGQVNEENEINHFRLTESSSDMSCPKQTESLKKLVQLFPGCDLWGSIPCGPWSQLQHLNIARLGNGFREKLRKKRQRSRRILKNFISVAEVVLAQGGHVSFEWPQGCSGWALPELTQFIQKHGLFTAVTHGCAHGLMDDEGTPHKKPWRVVTSCWKLADNLNTKRCQHPPGFQHSTIEGSKTAKTAKYTRSMATTIVHSLYPHLSSQVAAMPVMPSSPHCHVPRTPPKDQEMIYAGIHHLIDRKDWGKHAGAQECIDGEAKGLISNGTWDYREVVSRRDLLARKEPLNIGRLMTILSIKHFETPELRKLKARIVFRGDDIRDEANNLAILQELKVNPTGIVGINFNLAYGAIKGHCSSQSDVVKAYTQSDLNTKVPTWVELPRELTPPEFRGIERPCVRLWKSLYGHPESGFHWHERFKQVMSLMGGEHSELFQSSFWFPKTRQLLTLYVDDIVLSGPKDTQAAFWEELQKHLDIEPPSEVDRVLGRKHVYQREGNTVMTYDMSDYCRNACDLYEQLSGRKLKEAATPFVAEGSLLTSDWETRGQLSDAASRVLMKSLWLARLSRPDVMKPLSDLTRRVTCWSIADDKRLFRLMCYLHSTPELSITHTMGDEPENLKLSLYTDADHASDVEHAHSTSGMILCIEGEHSFWPLCWASKKQTATSRSTTEAEIISLSPGVFGEALPMQQFMEKVFGREVLLQCHQDNSAVIQIVHAGYSPKLRHVSKTHRIDLSSLYEVYEDPYVRLTYINTDKQRADIFTKALAPAKFPAALQLLQME